MAPWSVSHRCRQSPAASGRFIVGDGIDQVSPAEARLRRPDYPMVAPNYSAQRQTLARRIGLDRKPAPTPPAPEPKPKRRRKSAG